MITLARVATLVTLAAAPALAQGRVVDEGTFVITRNGIPVGREVFRIVRSASASGTVYRATAQISSGSRRVLPALNTDSLGNPISYEVAVRDNGKSVVHLQARGRPGRLSVLEQTPTGESVKEYVVPPRLLLLDDEIFHQYFFVALARGAGALAVVIPQSREQVEAAMVRRGAETLQINGKGVAATRYALTVDGKTRDLWVDDAGRVLRVGLPERGLTAQRDEAPR